MNTRSTLRLAAALAVPLLGSFVDPTPRALEAKVFAIGDFVPGLVRRLRRRRSLALARHGRHWYNHMWFSTATAPTASTPTAT